MSATLTPPFRFMDLPTELRRLIFCFFFDFPNGINMKRVFQTEEVYTTFELAFWRNHRALCPLNTHRVILPGQKYGCRHWRTRREEILYPPVSRFDILRVSKFVKTEAMPVLFSNNLTFLHCEDMHRFILHVRRRYRLLTNVTLRFSSNSAVALFGILKKDCLQLKILNLIFDPAACYMTYTRNKPRIYRNLVGMNALLQLRGIETLNLAGRDNDPEQGFPGEQSISFDDEESIGPLLRRELTKPR